MVKPTARRTASRWVWGAIIQDAGYLRRGGWRGKWITCYLHRYAGGDRTETPHTHPWEWWASIVLRGRLTERRQYKNQPPSTHVRTPLTGIALVSGATPHQIIAARAGTITLFIGWRRCRRWEFVEWGNR